MGAFRTVIGYNSQQFENGSTEPNRYLILDIQGDKQINASATIAQQPLQDGDTMSDHMYRNPVTLNISGSFGINGKNWNDDSYDFMEKGDRLTNIQEVFENILNNGFLCTLTTINEDDYVTSNGRFTGQIKSNAKNRFKIRKNMALRSIDWVERQNTITFTFQFSEVIMVEAQEFEELTDEERMDLGLPKVTSPVGSSLGTILADTGKLPEIIIRALWDNGYIEQPFFQALAEVADAIVGLTMAAAVLAVGLAVAAITATKAILAVAAVVTAASAAGTTATASSILGAIAGSTSAVFPVGTIIVAVVAVVAAIAVAIWSFFNIAERHRQQEKRRKAFKLINGSPEQDGIRLKNLIDDIEVALNNVKTSITIYSISGEYEQQVILNMGGDYYIINFVKNNVGEYAWTATVEDLDGNPLDTVQHSWCPVANFTDLNRNQNLWFKDKSKQYEVYLVNPSLSDLANKTAEEVKNAKSKLEGYSIWVSKGDISPQVKKVLKAIDDAIIARGFD